ncbi:MAG: Threonylcarbamoyl-AMP synthase [Parcubacteria group bacterium ADurb.Bin326]|nr:MAG: Threonylcarbamoyl-AMP synthase [Parcubacteria group bacterium ADurb.Bin326]
MLKQEVIKKLKAGKIGVVPTDTIYGLVGQALNREAVETIYEIRRRSPDKPFIILISSIEELKSFGVNVSLEEKRFLGKYWPGAVSVILPCKYERLKYLHRGTKSLAFRLPKDKFILQILKETGPLVAPSANPEGLSPAENLKQAREYFGDKIFYYGRGRLQGAPSTLVSLNDGKVEVLRQGAVKVS